MSRTTRLLLAATLLCLAVSGTARADNKDDVYVIKKQKKKKLPQGWDASLSVGATFALTNNSNVVGQPDGTSVTIGGKMQSGLDWRRGPHEWRNTMSLAVNFTRTPAIPVMVKTADRWLIESIYLYRPRKLQWLGPFARAVFDTPILRGRDVRGGPTQYLITELDGTQNARLGSRIKLTDPFQPLTLRQSIGGFVKPLTRTDIAIETRVGFGASETFSKNGLAVNDDDATPFIELTRLDNVFQAGLEFTATAGGKLKNKSISYELGYDMLIPFINNDPDNRSAIDLANIEFYAKISFKLVKWASLDYEFRALRKPQLLDKWQVQNNLLLTFGWSFLEKDKEIKPKGQAEPKKK